MKTLTILNDDFHDRTVFHINGKFYAQRSGHELTKDFWIKLMKELGTTVYEKDVDVVE